MTTDLFPEEREAMDAAWRDTGCTHEFPEDMRISFVGGWQAAREYSKQREEELLDALHHARAQEIAGRHDWCDDPIVLDALAENGDTVSKPQREIPAASHDYPLVGFELTYTDGAYKVSRPNLLKEGERLHVVPASMLASADRWMGHLERYLRWIWRTCLRERRGEKHATYLGIKNFIEGNLPDVAERMAREERAPLSEVESGDLDEC